MNNPNPGKLEIQKPENEEVEKYNRQWFIERAYNSIKPIRDGIWDFSDSLLLYLPESESQYEEMQEGDNPYAEIITKPEEMYLKNVAETVVTQLPDEFEYIDLGPGTVGKERYIFEAAKKLDKKIIYRPVDISQYYLEKSRKYAIAYDIKTNPINCSFEELQNILELEKDGLPRFVSLGLTFSNFNPQDLLKLLSGIAGKKGFIFINSQIRDRVDITKLTEIYNEDAKVMGANKLKLLGIDTDDQNLEMLTDDSVKVWFTLRNIPYRLAEMGVKAGDKFLVFQSLRPTKESLQKDLDESGLDYEQFDIGSSFIGTLLRTK
jgi:hypothetical protein